MNQRLVGSLPERGAGVSSQFSPSHSLSSLSDLLLWVWEDHLRGKQKLWPQEENSRALSCWYCRSLVDISLDREGLLRVKGCTNGPLNIPLIDSPTAQTPKTFLFSLAAPLQPSAKTHLPIAIRPVDLFSPPLLVSILCHGPRGLTFYFWVPKWATEKQM